MTPGDLKVLLDKRFFFINIGKTMIALAVIGGVIMNFTVDRALSETV